MKPHYLPWQHAYLRHLRGELDAETTAFMLDNTAWDTEKAQAFQAGYDACKENMLQLLRDMVKHADEHSPQQPCEKCGCLGDDNKIHEFNKCIPCNGTGRVASEPIHEPVTNAPTESQFRHGVWLDGTPGNLQPPW